MARVMLAWEMGANLGHIDRLLVLARALRARGHEAVFVLRDLSRAQPRIAAEGFTLGQAPVWLPRLANPPQLGNYTAVLANAGWLDAAGLAGLLCGWRTWFDLLRPEVLVCDHAPTALLALRTLAWPMQVWAIGSSFEIPPTRAGVFPAFAAGDARAVAACAGHDAALLQPANAALGLLGAAPMQQLTEVFGPVRRVLTTLPELAHYAGYGAEVTWAGPSYAGDSGLEPQWPAAGGRRAFVYLDPGHAAFEPVMKALQACGLSAIVHAKGLAPAAASRLGTPQLRFEAQPLRMDAVVRQADLVVSHGGQGTLAAAALAGKPQLLLPQHIEQAMAARRVAAAGLGLVMEPASSCAALLRRLLDEPAFAQAAGAFAERHAMQSPAQTADLVAELIGAALCSAAPGSAPAVSVGTIGP
jgi:hypothetical protein